MNYPPNGPQQPYTQYPPQQPGYPQQPQMPMQQPPKKSKKGLWITLGIIAGAIALCGVFGAIASHGNTGTKVTSNGSTTTTTQSAPQQHFKVGDTVKVGDTWQATVTASATKPPGQFSTLKSGNVYLLVDVSLTNISKEEQVTSSLIDWKLTGTDGQSYSTTFDSEAPAAPDGKVEPGNPAKGTLVFEVPSSVKEFRLAFAPSLLASGQTIWDLTPV